MNPPPPVGHPPTPRGPWSEPLQARWVVPLCVICLILTALIITFAALDSPADAQTTTTTPAATTTVPCYEGPIGASPTTTWCQDPNPVHNLTATFPAMMSSLDTDLLTFAGGLAVPILIIWGSGWLFRRFNTKGPTV